MVLGKILIDVATVVGRTVGRYYKYESKIFDSAYRGIPRDISRGARHGYVAGSVLGQLIGEDDGVDEDGIFTPKTKPSPNQFKKTYQRRTRSTSRRYSNRRCNCNHCRQSRTYKSRRS